MVQPGQEKLRTVSVYQSLLEGRGSVTSWWAQGVQGPDQHTCHFTLPYHCKDCSRHSLIYFSFTDKLNEKRRQSKFAILLPAPVAWLSPPAVTPWPLSAEPSSADHPATGLEGVNLGAPCPCEC